MSTVENSPMRTVIISAIILGCATIAAAQPFCTIPSPTPKIKPAGTPPPVCDRECPHKCQGSPCFIATGVYTNDFLDLAIQTTGFPLTVSRHYESERFIDGPIGVGWSSSLTPKLFEAVYAVSSSTDYRELEYLTPDGQLLPFSESATGAYTAPIGRNDELVRNTDGTYDLTLQRTRSIYHFNADGTIDTMSDDFANKLKFTYDTNGRVLRVADQAGSARYLDVTWNANGRIATITDSASRTITYTYAGDGTLTGVTDPLARTSTYSYTNGRFGPLLQTALDPWQRVLTTLEWDSNGRLHSYTDGDYSGSTPTGSKYTYEYFPDNKPAPLTVKTNVHTATSMSYTYDVSSWLLAGPTYDALGRLVKSSDGTAYEYDDEGHVTRVTYGIYPTNYVRYDFTYDSVYRHNVSTVTTSGSYTTAADWPQTIYTYYGAGSAAPGALQYVKKRASDLTTIDQVESFEYDSAGRVTAHVDGLYGMHYAYNAAGDLISTTRDGDSAQTTFTYDALGRMLTSTDPMGRLTSYTYDAADRVLTMTAPKPSSTSTFDVRTTTTYDHFDSATAALESWTTDPNGNVTKIGRDALGGVVRTVDALGNVTRFRYEDNLLASVTDANGNVTSYTYDTTRQLSGTTFPNGTSETYPIWRSDGLLGSRTDRNGVTTSYEYDVIGRLTRQTFSTLGGAISWNYTGAKLMSIIDSTRTPNDTISYSYDSRFRVLTETQAARAKITYTYAATATSQPTSYTVGPATGAGYSPLANLYYDNVGRLSQIDWSAGGLFTLAYNKTDQYTSISTPSGLYRTYTYDGAGRLVMLSNEHAVANNVATFNYGYDYNWATNDYTMIGQRTSVTRSGIIAPTGTTKYRYDAEYQLVRADDASGAWESWQYDPIGNRTRRTYSTGLYTDYTYYKNGTNTNNGQRLRSVGGSSPPVDITYDANGNQTGTTVSPNQYTWDVKNRFTAAATTYDARDRRVVAGLGTVTTYAYEGLNPVAAITPYTNSYHYFLFGPGIDQPLARSVASTQPSQSYVVDGLGSAYGLVTAAGDVVNSTDYSAWGERTGDIGALGYTARESMPNSFANLWYYRARVYDPQVGRFLSEDPLNNESSDAEWRVDTDPYTYALNQPTEYVDPSGLSGSRPGGPYHPPNGVSPGCTRGDSCSQIVGKMWVLQRMISSHTGWDRNMAPPRGGGRHAKEIAELWGAYANCQAIYALKCGKRQPNCETCARAAKTAGAAVGLYVVYRCVRMIPSLFPPLWPTIPVNAVAP